MWEVIRTTQAIVNVTVIALTIIASIAFITIALSTDSDASSEGYTCFSDVEEDYPMKNAGEHPLGTPQLDVEVLGLADISEYTIDGIPVYESTGLMEVRVKVKNDESEDWKISNDTYGEKSQELVAGTYRGMVKGGCIVVQVYDDQKGCWIDYKGITRYDSVPTISDNNLALQGTTVRVILFREYCRHSESNTYLGSMLAAVSIPWHMLYEWIWGVPSETYLHVTEVRTLRLTNSNVDSLKVKLLKDVGETRVIRDYQVTQEIEAYIEDSFVLMDGSVCLDGVILDRAANPYIDIEMEKDGDPYNPVWQGDSAQITEQGAYSLKIRAGRTEKIASLYVVTEALIDDTIRVDTDDAIRVAALEPACYAGSISISVSNQEYMPQIDITILKDGCPVKYFDGMILSEAGRYQVRFSLGSPECGSRVCISYCFQMVSEAPGPRLNQERLKASCAFPEEAYSFIVPTTAGNGSVQMLYRDREHALDALVEYELSNAVRTDDGTYNWREFRSIHPTEVIGVVTAYASEQILHPDLTDRSICWYTGEPITDVLALDLYRTVTFYGEGDIPTGPPQIGRTRSYCCWVNDRLSYRTAITDAVLINEFEGIDSYKACATMGARTINLEYNVSLFEQFRTNGFSGEITITEQNVYGQSSSYEILVLGITDIGYSDIKVYDNEGPTDDTIPDSWMWCIIVASGILPGLIIFIRGVFK
ncbi:MAG: hypothetical protein II855_03355 [Candidatus Methanomethylophilaceae archaeon]|nr:hypothetical protein [Candidatus Methanomethylophilaceae archaeon]